MMMEWERHRGQCNRSPGIYITTEDKFTTPHFGNRRTVGDLQDLGGQNSFLQLSKQQMFSATIILKTLENT